MRPEWVNEYDAAAVCVTGWSEDHHAGHWELSTGTVFPLVAPSLEQEPWLSTWSSGLPDAWHLIFSLWKNSLLCINRITRKTLCSIWQPRKILQGYFKGWDGFRRQCWLCVKVRGRVIAQVLAVVGDKTALSIACGSASVGLFLALILYAGQWQYSYCSYTCLQREMNWWQNFSASPWGKWVRFLSLCHLVQYICLTNPSRNPRYI